ncbi:hypothetical protein P3T22_006611 [Paraburkholderia sp. GAS348]
MRKSKESILSLASAARRTGSVIVVLGPENTRLCCTYHVPTDTFQWHVDDSPCPASRVSWILESLQDEQV